MVRQFSNKEVSTKLHKSSLLLYPDLSHSWLDKVFSSKSDPFWCSFGFTILPLCRVRVAPEVNEEEGFYALHIYHCFFRKFIRVAFYFLCLCWVYLMLFCIVASLKVLSMNVFVASTNVHDAEIFPRQYQCNFFRWSHYSNVEIYINNVKRRTSCCGTLYTLTLVSNFQVSEWFIFIINLIYLELSENYLYSYTSSSVGVLC